MTTPEAEDALIGTTLASQFRIQRRLGAGGMGAVYLAEQVGVERPVVVKVMHADLAGGAKAVERFKREAKAVAALNHPNVVSVYAFGHTEEGQLFLAMELVDGHDLTKEVKAGPMAEARALGIIEQTLAALVEAHSHGIVHRDLKPENVMLTHRHGNPDWVKVLDFGIAKVMGEDVVDRPALTREGAVFGTPRYMAPEQARGQRVDARTDLYSLGLVLYEVLAAGHPFGERSPLDYMVAQASEEVPPLDGVSVATAEVLSRALAKDPDDRFASAREMKDAVGRALAALSDSAPARPRAATVASPARSPAAPARRALWPWFALGGVAAGGVALALALGGSSTPAAPDAGAAATGRSTASTVPSGATTPTEPTTAPPVEATAALDAGVGEVAIAEGPPIDGFPIPAGSTVARQDDLTIVLNVAIDQRAVMAFYKAKLDQRGWRWEKFPNGLRILDERSPFSSLMLLRYGSALQLTLGRSTGR